jgi:hypothetical protein
MLASLALPLLTALQVSPDAGPDQTVTFPAAAVLAGSVTGGAPLEWWTADGNYATEDMLIRVHGVTGAYGVGPLSNGSQIYGWLGDIVDVGGVPWGNAVLTRELFTIDPDTGLCTTMTAPFSSQFDAVHSMAYDAAGDRLFAVDLVDRQLLRLDRTVGGATQVGNSTLSAWPLIRALAYDAAQDRLLAVDQATDALIEISPTTGAATFLTTVAVFPNARLEDLTFFGGALYASLGYEDSGVMNRGQLLRVDPLNGTTTDVGPEVLDVSPHCLYVESVPEAVQWSQLAGPGAATFSDPTVLDPSVSFSHPGVYALELAVFAAAGTVTDTVTVTSVGYESFCHGDGSGAACPCGNTGGAGEGCANSGGYGGLLRNVGGISAGADDAVLEASQLPANKFGIVFAGVNTKPQVAFGDGLRCVKGFPLLRYPVQSSGAGGAITQPELVLHAKGFITAGSTWYAQCWYRDLASVCGAQTNLTGGIALTFGP